MRIIYVAGKYRDEHPYKIQENIDKAKEVAKEVWAYPHFAAICPHMNSAHFEGINSEQHFIDATLEMMLRCDAVLLVPGWETSEGTIGEIKRAKELDMPVFETLQGLINFYKEREQLIKENGNKEIIIEQIPINQHT